MPYTKEHKERTRRRIVAEAAKAFRSRGVAGIAIPDLMRRAGLTHGGFYAHFESKDALVAEACAEGFVEAAEELMARTVAEAAPGEEMRAIIRAYLSRAHRDQPETGCMIPALAAEMAHEQPEVRHAFTEALKTYFGKLASYLPDVASATAAPNDDAMVLLSGMMGALVMARAVDDRALSDRILQVARTFYMQSFADAHETRRGRDAARSSTQPNAERPGGKQGKV